ncbi:MAG: response regulator transcription factor [Actinomycetaceae bacterium]|nr:response regulator transcription factor [Actinomycetaceae bacterium]
MKILLVEDDNEINNLVTFYLKRKNWEVCSASTYSHALQQLNDDFSVFVFDVMLPDGNGLELVEKAKQRFPSIPVIVISARTSSLDRVTGFEHGSDDYITKPFLPEELIYRVDRLVQRSAVMSTISLTHYIIDTGERSVYCRSDKVEQTSGKAGNDDDNTESKDGTSHVQQKIELTTKEFDIVMYLVNHRNMALSREQIMQGIGDDPVYMSGRIIDNQIKNIRKKMPKIHIDTIYGYGYRLNG